MEKVGNFAEAESRVLSDLRDCIEAIRSLTSRDVASVGQGIEMLSKLRQAVYEDINQIQHEAMVLHAAQFLRATEPARQPVCWYWNPRQTGDITEPDLRGELDGEIVVSAEVTTSDRPVGSIDRRMAHTLRKLNDMPGRRTYFVRTDSMAQRARTKVEKSGYEIDVVQI